MLRVSEQAKESDTGRQRRVNEDSFYVRSPLFVVADGMGGAQAGEVASGLAVEVFAGGMPDGEDSAEARLAERVAEANQAIHDASRRDADRAGMGTTLTAAYVGADDVTIAHVGDSRAYRWRAGTLERLTDDHTLVEELKRQGRLSEQEADTHPQRSIITRALGPEPKVRVDTHTVPTRDGDVFLICSDGLTGMITEETIADLIGRGPTLRDTARGLVDAANAAGGRDNITVVLFRVEEVEAAEGAPAGDVTASYPVVAAVPPADTAAPDDLDAAPSTEQIRAAVAEAEAARVPARVPRPRREAAAARRKRSGRWGRRLTVALVVGALLCAVAIGVYAGITSIYFVGTDSQGRVAIFRGLPYELPLGIDLYRTEYRSGIPASELPAIRRKTLLDHKLRSHDDAVDLVRQLELGQLQGSSQ
jgi:serine/threonine protein phosphatase PrpC